MDTTTEEKLMEFAPTVTGYYNWEHLANDLPNIETAYTQGVILCYQMLHGHRDSEELERFNKIMLKYKY